MGENFQQKLLPSGTPPIFPALHDLTDSRSFLLVSRDGNAAQPSKVTTLRGPLRSLNAAAEREKVW